VPRPLLIANPLASAVTERRTAAVAAALGGPELRYTEWPGHATELTREAAGRGVPVFVFSGDGGFNEALNGIDGSTPLGFVPGGGSSVLPRALGLPRDPIDAAQRLAAGRVRRINVGRANGRRFGFSAGVGIDAELMRRVERLGRSRGRRARDVRVAWLCARILAERRAGFPAALELKGIGRAAFALVANCDPYSYVGPIPLRVVPEASFDLGLDVVAPRELRLRHVPRFLAYVLSGHGQVRAGDVYYRHDLDRLEVACDVPMPFQMDGEFLGDVTEVAYEAERDAVTVLV
jgi:diacylglycerol kinase family enzyme